MCGRRHRVVRLSSGRGNRFGGVGRGGDPTKRGPFRGPDTVPDMGWVGSSSAVGWHVAGQAVLELTVLVRSVRNRRSLARHLPAASPGHNYATGGTKAPAVRPA